MHDDHAALTPQEGGLSTSCIANSFSEQTVTIKCENLIKTFLHLEINVDIDLLIVCCSPV